MLRNIKITGIVALILLSLFSGCTLFSFFEETKFNLISSVLTDDEGFTSLLLHFNPTDQITLKLLGPEENVLFLEEYYQEDNESIPLEDYRTTPSPGNLAFASPGNLKIATWASPPPENHCSCRTIIGSTCLDWEV